MREYTCVSKVQAMRIDSVLPEKDGCVEFTEDSGAQIHVVTEWYDRQLALFETDNLVGYYMVTSIDGRASVVPSEVFEAEATLSSKVEKDFSANIANRLRNIG